MAAHAEDAIYVHAGTYYENVDVDKRLALIGDTLAGAAPAAGDDVEAA